MKYGELDLGRIEATVNKLGGMEGLERFLRGELVIAPKAAPISGAANGGVTFTRPQVPDPQLFLEEMKMFYGEVYDVMALPEVCLPGVREGFSWGLIMLPGLTMEADLAAMAKQFPVWRWTNNDLDKFVGSVREAAKGPYSVWFRDRVEADVENALKSYDDLKREGVNGITLPERIRLERWFYWRTGQHLDVRNWTLCSDSRYLGGGVPGAYGHDGGFRVSWYVPRDALLVLRPRAVVV